MDVMTCRVRLVEFRKVVECVSEGVGNGIVIVDWWWCSGRDVVHIRKIEVSENERMSELLRWYVFAYGF